MILYAAKLMDYRDYAIDRLHVLAEQVNDLYKKGYDYEALSLYGEAYGIAHRLRVEEEERVSHLSTI